MRPHGRGANRTRARREGPRPRPEVRGGGAPLRGFRGGTAGPASARGMRANFAAAPISSCVLPPWLPTIPTRGRLRRGWPTPRRARGPSKKRRPAASPGAPPPRASGATRAAGHVLAVGPARPVVVEVRQDAAPVGHADLHPDPMPAPPTHRNHEPILPRSPLRVMYRSVQVRCTF